MIRLVSALAAVAVVALTTGCPAFFVDRGEITAPKRDLSRPQARSLPAASAYVDLKERWRREARLGLGGFVEATFQDPALAAAELAHEAALQELRGAELDTLIANRWTTWYGLEGDRFPIDIRWRFDEQFVTKAAILDPATWKIELVTSAGRRYQPVSVAVLASEPTPQNGYWEGAVRLWFPWRDPASSELVLAGHTSWAALSLSHPAGSGELVWRFRSQF